jgi:hypothetical protein
LLKELEEEEDFSKVLYGMSLGSYVPEDEDEDETGGLTRSVKAGSKVNCLWVGNNFD